jgi:predicted component of type VI protein secretion system
MPPASKVLGILKPIGGGDPVPLTKETLRVGRRPSNDICLDFERISGKHCELRFFHGLWHIRDIGSTNGTTVNGLKYATEQSVLPDVEIGIGGHLYTIDYEPAGPSSVVEGSQLLDDDVIETRTRKSLMELAGLEVEGPRKSYRPAKPPESIERPTVDEADFDHDDIPKDLPEAKPLPMVEASDDDFFNMIADDITPKKK